jgi:RNA polymerase sigma factor (sigma-70 family)
LTATSRSSEVELSAALDGLAHRAAEGDRDALTELVREIEHPMYRLALRFLGNPDDAQDACQEILIRIITRLGTFEGRSKFSTWAYTVGVRSLLRTRKRLYESAVRGAQEYAAALDAGMGDVDPTLEEAEYRLLAEEVRISCTYGMLLCLPRAQRAAYVLADVLGLTDAEGAEVLDTTRDAFRQRVSRARRTLRVVIDNRCGLVDPANPCRCGRQIASGEAAGLIDRTRLPLARHPRKDTRVWIEPVARQLDAIDAIGELYRFDRFAAPAELWDDLQTRFPDLLKAG